MQFKLPQSQRKARGIYRINNEVSGTVYIGSAAEFNTRWLRHARDLRANRHANKYLQSAFLKYGEGAFVFEVLSEVGAHEDILAIEQRYLTAYFGEGCYNQCPTVGCPSRKDVSLETRAKLSAANKGKKRTPEQRARYSAAFTGRVFSEASREKMSRSAQKRIFSPELRVKMAAGRRANYARQAASKDMPR